VPDPKRGEKAPSQDTAERLNSLSPRHGTRQDARGLIDQMARFVMFPDAVIFHWPTKTL
jgi:hypothetical protein